jgi:hypothetical protein
VTGRTLSNRRPAHRRRGTDRTARSHRARRGSAVLAVLIIGVAAVLASGARSDASTASGCTVGAPASQLAGCQGQDTQLPKTDSQVVVKEPNSGSAFPNLTVTVNQTKDLVNQDVSLSWTGGTATTGPNGTGGSDFGGDYLQIFECWGDPETTNPAGTTDPGPSPTQCEFGGESATPTNSYPIQGNDVGFEYSRVLAQPSWSTYAQLDDCTTVSTSPCTIPGYSNLYYDAGTPQDPGTDFVVDPFDAVDGTVVGQQADYGAVDSVTDPFWKNPYFSFDTTNEVDFARTYSDGTGQQLFQVDTGLEAPGLGCGQDIEPVAGGGTTTPQCWLVVVPRSTPDQENPTGIDGNTANVNSAAVVTSPLTPQAWANRIAIPLGFNPVGSSCSLNADSDGIAGNELASIAASSWEPALCDQSSSTSYSYLEESDDQARSNLTSPTYGSVGMSVFSDPIGAGQTSSTDPPVYAPLTLSGVVVGFNIDRVPALDGGAPQPDELAVDGTRIQNIYLTPRLVAKLLTQSYLGQLKYVATTKPTGYSWALNNPLSLFTDPDFLQYNPEFSLLSASQLVDAGTLLVEQTSSDAATALWKWVLSDPEAEAWLHGDPWPADPTTMVVNPYYSTNAATNPSGIAFGTSTPETYPKNDPYCETLDSTSLNQTIQGQVPRPLCILDWAPYAQTMQAAAQAASVANDGAKTTFNPAAVTASAAWGSNPPQSSGTDLVMTITDSASAARYGLQTASLSASGDDGVNPTFVAPNAAGLLAGEQAMKPSSVLQVLQPNPSSTGTGAYPLTMLSYGVTTPESLTPAERTEYAAFIKYAANAGQISGDAPGDLPAGYVPLPGALVAQDTAAEQSILNPPVAPAATTPAPTAVTTPTSILPDISDLGSTMITAAAPAPTTPAAAKQKIRLVKPVALSLVRTQGVPIGLVRWILPLALLFGLIAALAAVVLSWLGRTRKPNGLPQQPPSAEASP